MAFPFRLDSRGRTATVDEDTHIRDLIEQVLFTNPGERVMRPTFGSGLLQLVFAPSNGEVAAATKFLVEGALQQWLGDAVAVERVDIVPHEERIEVEVRYTDRRTNRPGHARYTRRIP